MLEKAYIAGMAQVVRTNHPENKLLVSYCGINLLVTSPVAKEYEKTDWVNICGAVTFRKDNIIALLDGFVHQSEEGTIFQPIILAGRIVKQLGGSGNGTRLCLNDNPENKQFISVFPYGKETKVIDEKIKDIILFCCNVRMEKKEDSNKIFYNNSYQYLYWVELDKKTSFKSLNSLFDKAVVDSSPIEEEENIWK